MAARKRLRPEDWHFYVYACGSLDAPVYVGKGSNLRLRRSGRRVGAEPFELARFHCEADAYAFEAVKIAELCPPLNKMPGGGGSRCLANRKPPEKRSYNSWVERMLKLHDTHTVCRMMLEKRGFVLVDGEFLYAGPAEIAETYGFKRLERRVWQPT